MFIPFLQRLACFRLWLEREDIARVAFGFEGRLCWSSTTEQVLKGNSDSQRDGARRNQLNGLRASCVLRSGGRYKPLLSISATTQVRNGLEIMFLGGCPLVGFRETKGTPSLGSQKRRPTPIYGTPIAKSRKWSGQSKKKHAAAVWQIRPRDPERQPLCQFCCPVVLVVQLLLGKGSDSFKVNQQNLVAFCLNVRTLTFCQLTGFPLNN